MGGGVVGETTKLLGYALTGLTLLLDSGANLNLIGNSRLLKNIRQSARKSKKIAGVNGESTINQVGSLSDELSQLPLNKDADYFYSEGAQNILSLAVLADSNRVFMDTSIDDAFYVFDGNGGFSRFARCPANNLYRLDLEESDEAATVLSMVTVEDKMKEYSSLDVRRA